MNRLALIAAIAVGMILVAFGMSRGFLPADSGEGALALMPAIAIALIQSRKGCAPGGCRA